ncbi:MAG: UbiD family decarboxylase [Betaproteobacteria bacterium]|nr:UbiD family decarboxylase [Betaproteobacteria bacterium]
MAYYKDIREYLEALDRNGKLRRIKRLVNKDTELVPFVNLQFRGLPEAERTAFVFDNITDVKGRRYRGSVLLGALGGSEQIYALGLMCRPEEIMHKRAQTEANPIEPRLVDNAPVHEEVHMGDSLLEHGGLEEFPVPIFTPGYDPGPALTAPFWVTRDPESGVRNVGTYRALLKSPTKTGLDFCSPRRGIAVHWNKARERGEPLQAAIVIGGPPSVGYCSSVDYPADVDEFTMAGAIAGAPLEIVKCKTVDLEVPAHAEIVIEGEIATGELENEGPFGEAIGYMSLTQPRPYFTVKCITHRRDPVLLGMISQFQPSESSKIRCLGNSASTYRHLRDVAGFDAVRRFSIVEMSNAMQYAVVQVAQDTPTEEVWRILEAILKHRPDSKIIVAVNEDIDPEDFDSVVWAFSTRFQPHRDARIVSRPASRLTDVSLAPMEVLEAAREDYVPDPPTQSYLLMDATMKWPLPPVSLPKREFMERAAQMWREEGLPELKLKEPYFGRNLGYWHEEDVRKAEWALQGDYAKTGELQSTQIIPGGPHFCAWAKADRT